MKGWPRLIGLTAALCAVVISAPLLSPTARGDTTPQTRLILGGAEYEWGEWFPAIAALPLVTRYVTPNRQIGAGFFPASVPVLIDYPGSLFRPGTANEHINIGLDRLDGAIKQRQGPLAIVGQSQGTVILDRMRARLEDDPAAPPADQLQFVLFNSPTRGLATTLFRKDVRIPIVDVTVTAPAESRYDTSLVIHEYDIWGDFPDRPWYPVTLLNALATMAFVHQLAYEVPGDIASENVTTVVNSKGATDTTYFVPAPRLPLTEVLRLVGVPGEAVDRLDEALRPIIDAGYSRNDKPGDARLFLDRGVLTTHQQSARGVAPSPASALAVASATASGPALPELTAATAHGRGAVSARPAGPSASGPSASGPSDSGPSASGPSDSGPSASGQACPAPASLEQVRRETPRPQSTVTTRGDRATPAAVATVGGPPEARSTASSTARATHRDRRR